MAQLNENDRTNEWGYDPAAYDEALRRLVADTAALLPPAAERAAMPSTAYGTYSDYWVARFLRARATPPRQFEHQKSVEMLKACVQWRVKHRVDHVLDGPPPHPGIDRLLPNALAGETRCGCSVYIQRLGGTRLPTACSSNYITYEDLCHWKRYISEVVARDIWTRRRRVLFVIIDCKNLSLTGIATPTMIRFMKMQGEVDGQCYPESLWKVFMVNTSPAVSAAWNIVKGAFDKKVQEKLNFIAGDYESHLKKHVEPSKLVNFLNGGQLQVDMPMLRGAPTAKSHDGMRRYVAVKAGQQHRCRVDAPAGTTVRWGFSTEKDAIQFEVRSAGGAQQVVERERQQCVAEAVRGEAVVPAGASGVELVWTNPARLAGEHLRYSTDPAGADDGTSDRTSAGGGLVAQRKHARTSSTDTNASYESFATCLSQLSPTDRSGYSPKQAHSRVGTDPQEPRASSGRRSVQFADHAPYGQAGPQSPPQKGTGKGCCGGDGCSVM